MKGKRHGWVRAGLTLAVLGTFAAALLISPAGAHITSFAHLKKHIRTIAKKVAQNVAQKEATTVVQTTTDPATVIEETELVRWGPIELAVGQTAPIGTFGPFTLTAQCDSGGAGTDVALVTITTSAEHSAFRSNEDADDDFNPGDAAGTWARGAGDATLQSLNSQGDGNSHAAAPNGAVIRAVGTSLALNFSGSDCFMAGAVLVTPAS